MPATETSLIPNVLSFSIGGVIALVGITSVITYFVIIALQTKKSTTCDKAKQCTNVVGTKTKEKCPALMQKDFNHMVILFAVIMLFVFTNLLVGDATAFDYISFASTITSIVLSVIAIFMTISSESKTDNMKIAIDESVRKLEETAENVKKYTEGLGAQEQVIRDILKNTKEINERVTKFKPVDNQNITPGIEWDT